MMIDLFLHAAFLLQELKFLKEDSAIKDEQFAAEVDTVVLLAGSCRIFGACVCANAAFKLDN